MVKRAKVTGDELFSALKLERASAEQTRHMRLFMRLANYSWGIVGASAFTAALLWKLKQRVDESTSSTVKNNADANKSNNNKK